MSTNLCSICGRELSLAPASVDGLPVESAIIYCDCPESEIESYTIEETEEYIEYFREEKPHIEELNNREKLILQHVGGTILEVQTSLTTDTLEGGTGD